MHTLTPHKTSTIVAPEEQINAGLIDSFKKTALSAAIVVLILSIAEMVGYALDITWIKHPIEDSTIPSGMTSGSAVSFLLISIGLLLRSGTPPLWRRIVSMAIGCVVFLAALAAFFEHVCQQDWNLGFVLWQPGSGADLSFPGPMLPDTSASVMLLGLAVAAYGIKLVRTEIYPYQILAVLSGLPNLMIVVCYFCGMVHLCGYFGCLKFSPITSLMFATTAYCLLSLNPENGFTNFLLRDTIGGAIFRRSFPVVILLFSLLPLRLWLIAEGSRLQIIDETLATGLVALIGLVVIAVFVIWCSKNIDNLGTEKSQVEELLKESIITNLPQQNFKLVCLSCTQEFADDIGMVFCPEDGGTLLRLVDDLKAGCTFAGRYEIVRVLGSGGMSSVYLVNHLLLKKPMALKLLHSHLLSSGKAVQRFQREAQAASYLKHENLLEVHDFGITAAGQPYLVMDYLDGCSLEDYIKFHGAMNWKSTVEIMLQLCEGMTIVHENSIVHRDLKPANVMLVPNGAKFIAKVVDFGLAKSLESDSFQDLTQSGEVFGSPLYMSPEQCGRGKVDQRSDIYALGCILYYCLAGETPFEGETIQETLTKQLLEPPPALPPHLAVPAWLEAAMRTAMEKTPKNRFQTTREFVAELKHERRVETQRS